MGFFDLCAELCSLAHTSVVWAVIVPQYENSETVNKQLQKKNIPQQSHRNRIGPSPTNKHKRQI